MRTRQTMLRDIDRHHDRLALEQAAVLAQQLWVEFKTLQPTGYPEQVMAHKSPDLDLVVLACPWA